MSWPTNPAITGPTWSPTFMGYLHNGTDCNEDWVVRHQKMLYNKNKIHPIRENCGVQHLKVSCDKNGIDPICENWVVQHNLLDCVNWPSAWWASGVRSDPWAPTRPRRPGGSRFDENIWAVIYGKNLIWLKFRFAIMNIYGCKIPENQRLQRIIPMIILYRLFWVEIGPKLEGENLSKK
jgi:hypothetical protein